MTQPVRSGESSALQPGIEAVGRTVTDQAYERLGKRDRLVRFAGMPAQLGQYLTRRRGQHRAGPRRRSVASHRAAFCDPQPPELARA